MLFPNSEHFTESHFVPIIKVIRYRNAFNNHHKTNLVNNMAISQFTAIYLNYHYFFIVKYVKLQWNQAENRMDERQQLPEQRVREEHAIVLDFLPHGYPFDNPSSRKTPIIQAIGKEHLVLLELAPKREVFLQPMQDVYIGEGKREQVHHILGRLDPDKLTATARDSLDTVIKEVVSKNEQRFVEFFNKSQPLTTRMHQLELLPGLGKKHMWEILEKREQPFTSFQDIKNRVKLMPDPEKIITKRILLEITGTENHRLFVDA